MRKDESHSLSKLPAGIRRKDPWGFAHLRERQSEHAFAILQQQQYKPRHRETRAIYRGKETALEYEQIHNRAMKHELGYPAKTNSCCQQRYF
ncbi:hypothetical protein AOLI_G00161250 [Acnodon oligacanthus]